MVLLGPPPIPEHKNDVCTPSAKVAVDRAVAELKKGTSLIFMANSNLGDGGIQVLIQGLGGHPGLRSLNLNGNQISDAGAAQLAKALPQLEGLEVLTLNTNMISDRGAALLGAALERHPRLRVLGLDSNRITDTGAATLLTSLACASRRGINCTLGGNAIQRLSYTALAEISPSAAMVKHLGQVGVTLKELLPLFEQACKKGTIDPWKTSTNEAVRSLVFPATSRSGKSYVETLCAANPAPTTMVIHAWSGLFRDLLKAVASHASGKPDPDLDPKSDLWKYDPQFLDKAYFIDAFCVNQHGATNRWRAYGTTDGGAFGQGEPECQIDKLDLVGEQVRRRGGHLLVAVDSKNRLLARLACLREIHQAVKAGMPMEANFISMQEAHGKLAQHGEAASEKDQMAWLNEIREMPGGYEAFDKVIVDFINKEVDKKWRERVQGKQH